MISGSQLSLLQNSLGSGIYCREELLSLGARASRPHKTWQGRGDWLHRVGRFTRRLTLEQRLDKYAGGTPALPGGNPWLARCRSLSRALFCRSILPPSHARLRILQKAQLSCIPEHPQIRTRSSPKSASRPATSRPGYPVHPVHRCSIFGPSRLVCSVAGARCAQNPDAAFRFGVDHESIPDSHRWTGLTGYFSGNGCLVFPGIRKLATDHCSSQQGPRRGTKKNEKKNEFFRHQADGGGNNGPQTPAVYCYTVCASIPLQESR